MEEEKFKSLTPKVSGENKKVYNEALDFAFNNNDIKNIAIAGNFGSGKSTVWNIYMNERKMKNIIMLSLGKYEDEPIKYYNEKKEEQSDETKKEEQIEENNKIERKIINQILAQIKAENIPLSKYKFKENKSSCYAFKQTLPIIFIILGIVGLRFKKEIEKLFMPTLIGKRVMFIFNVLSILCPIIYYAFEFIKYNKINISKISIKGTEANFGEEFKEDETILDRDMREIVYLLSNSDTNAVVFEDLDRYDNNEIFTKLRELNFLLNSYINTQKPNNNKPIRFVYMVRDGLFFSKNRTKFFDFIIPIVPIVDSKNSEAIILKELENSEYELDKSAIFKISLYIDDMRLLKNIINEYKIFENIIPLKEFELDPNKLFSLIVLKNVFPKEFELLQMDEGYIHNIMYKAWKFKGKLSDKYYDKLEKVEENLKFLYLCHLNKYEAMAARISTKVLCVENEEVSWGEFLEKQSKTPRELFKIKDGKNVEEINYDEFVRKYIYKDNKELKEYIEKLPENRKNKITELRKEKLRLEECINSTHIKSLKEILNKLKPDEVEKIFEEKSEEIRESHYFSLIRMLIMEGLIDETYWYYKGYFHFGSLAKNDMIFMKNILEGKSQDIFLNIENPDKIIEKLEFFDYAKFNILNKNLLREMINKKDELQLLMLMESVKYNRNYDLLIQILETYDDIEIKKFITLISTDDYEHAIEILAESKKGPNKVFDSVYDAIFDKEDTNKDIII